MKERKTDTESRPFLKIPQEGLFVYSDYKITEVTLENISPKIWSKKANYLATIYSSNWQIEDNDSEIFAGSWLVLKSEKIPYVFREGHFSHQVFDQLYLGSGEEERTLAIYFRLCPPEIAEEMLFASGILRREIPEDPIKAIRKALRGG